MSFDFTLQSLGFNILLTVLFGTDQHTRKERSATFMSVFNQLIIRTKSERPRLIQILTKSTDDISLDLNNFLLINNILYIIFINNINLLDFYIFHLLLPLNNGLQSH